MKNFLSCFFLFCLSIFVSACGNTYVVSSDTKASAEVNKPLENTKVTKPLEKPKEFPAPAPGELAPEFTFIDGAGKKTSLQSLRGSPVLVEFWASWCPDCHKAAPELNELYKMYQPKGVKFLSISTDKKKNYAEVEKVARDKLGLKMPLMAGIETQKISSSYKIEWIPTFFLIDQSGKIQGKFRDLKGESLSQLDKNLSVLSQK